MAIILLILSDSHIPICSLFRLFALRLEPTASAFQLLESGTISLQLFEYVSAPTHFRCYLKTHCFQQAFQSA